LTCGAEAQIVRAVSAKDEGLFAEEGSQSLV